MTLSLLTFPNKKLRKRSKKVVDFDGIRPIIPSMYRIMNKEDGVALAAPQVGIHRAFFITQNDVIVNPSWRTTENSNRYTVQEGCLSFPGLIVDILRWDTIEATWDDLDGQRCKSLLSGFNAQVFQHETEHLQGILFIDHLKGKK